MLLFAGFERVSKARSASARGAQQTPVLVAGLAADRGWN